MMLSGTEENIGSNSFLRCNPTNNLDFLGEIFYRNNASTQYVMEKYWQSKDTKCMKNSYLYQSRCSTRLERYL